MSWNIKTPGDYINGPLTVAGVTQFNSAVGVGVTPYASWPATSKALQLGASSAIEGRSNDGSRTALYTNAVWNGTNLIYQNTAAASYYQQSSGVHSWFTASAGTAGNAIAFNQAMTLDANGNLIVGGIYSQAPSATTIYNDGTINSILSSGAGGTTLFSAISGVSNGYQISVTAANEQTYTWFNGGTPSMRLDPLGNLLVGPSSANANGGCLQLRSGITFPVTQVASTDAKTLDDYEEGTWTPTIAASSGTPTTVTIGTCKYTKIGRQVIVTFDFVILDKGTASGSFIFALPFASDNFVNCGSFRENGLTGNMGQVFRNSTSDVAAFLYNNTTVWVNGYKVLGTYSYCV